MKCHYITDPKVGKVFIPGCWGGVHHMNMSGCYCPNHKKDKVQLLEEKVERLEKKIKELNNQRSG